MRLVLLPPLDASGACAINACAEVSLRRTASMSGSSASRIGGLEQPTLRLRDTTPPGKGRVDQPVLQGGAKVPKPAQQDGQRTAVIRVAGRPGRGITAGTFKHKGQQVPVSLY